MLHLGWQVCLSIPAIGLSPSNSAWSCGLGKRISVLSYNPCMEKTLSDDAEIFYDVAGSGTPVVLLHPTPADHEFFLPVSQVLSARYRLIMPDLRGHGESSLGNGS